MATKINSSGNNLHEIAKYYTLKLAEHGETARGVDWNGDASQNLRFAQLCKILPASGSFSLNDLGCGYGALVEYVDTHSYECSYAGFDVSSEMVGAARKRFQHKAKIRFDVSNIPDETADYGVASGIFNVRLDTPEAKWKKHIEASLDALNRTSRMGFSFNCLTSYSDSGKMRDYLHYADPCLLFDWCKKRYSRHVALLHDYGLYEFTILVRKEL